MHLIRFWDLYAAVFLIASAQGFFAWRFLRGMRRRSPQGEAVPKKDGFPSVRVFIPCAGVSAELGPSVEALLSQDYAGLVEFVFITPSASDPAHEELSILLAGKPRARLLFSGVPARACSDKINNLLHGLKHSPRDSEIVAFTDSDLRVPPGWISALIAPLSDPSVAAATSAMRYRAHGGESPASRGTRTPRSPSSPAGLAARLRSAWMAAGVPYLAAFGVPCGQSLAFRRADFENWRIEALWSRSLLEDLALHSLLQSKGRVVFVHEAMPSSEESADFPGFFNMTGRWLLAFRVYVPWMWAMGALVTVAKLFILFRALYPPGSRGLLAVLLFSDAAYLAALAAPGERLWAVLLSPLLTGVYAWGFARSILTRKVRWAAYRYLLRGPQDVEVL
ncbi:MAG: glycosyltransferase family 2 protein [Elusimicrobiota bacterium]